MTPETTMRRHAALVDNMAQTLGHDLEQSVLMGRLAPDEIPQMVLRCTGCADPDRCATWLQQNGKHPDSFGGTDRPAPQKAPDFCNNMAVFDQLSQA